MKNSNELGKSNELGTASFNETVQVTSFYTKITSCKLRGKPWTAIEKKLLIQTLELQVAKVPKVRNYFVIIKAFLNYSN